MKFIVYLMTMLFVGSAIAQNPTILQGSYISNVFGNSNFVLNPNAQTNVANVTNATRSTTTPLVATSEFTLALASGANATWTLRAFDSGMKGQNCEARFSYRGFATATTKAEIVQNSLVVAHLTLTPSTDPRIASINFPCGDLINATTFRIAQTTAAMTGTNEIGGIYVGLATNMANVAQAELVGMVTFNNGSAGKIGSTSTWTEFDAGTWTPTVIGQGTGSNRLQLAFSYLPAGRYFVSAVINPVVYGGATASHACRFGIQETTSNYVTAIRDNAATPATTYKTLFAPLTGTFDFTSGAARTFKIVVNGNGYAQIATGNCFSEQTSDDAKVQLAVYRFPSSSELVVTPERQNTFGGVRLYSNGLTNSVTATSPTKLTTAGTATRTLYGKADSTATNDLSITIKNLPVGSFKVEATGTFYTRSTVSGQAVACQFSLSDSPTAGSPITTMYQDAYGDATATTQDMMISSMSGVYVNTSVADRTFYVRALRGTGANGSCANYSDDGAPTTIIVTPLDQPSNSALYVQGPVLASATGAAIPAGYQMEGISSVSSSLTSQSNGAYKTGTGITLNPGVYFVTGYVETTNIPPTSTICGLTKTANGAPIDDDTSMITRHDISDSSNTLRGFRCKVTGYFRVTSATTFYTTNYVNAPTSSGYTFNYLINAIRLN